MGNDIGSLADRVLAGFDSRPPHVVWEIVEERSISDAYRVQHEVTLQREARGEKRVGYKVGCTSKTIQRQINIHSPIWGSLFQTGQHANHARLPLSRFAGLAVEGELAVTLDRDPRDLDSDKPLAAIETVFPVIELHNFAIPDASKNAPVLIANNAMHAGFVQPDPNDMTLQSISDLSLKFGDETVAFAESEELQETVENSLHWLASRLRENAALRCVEPPVTVLCGSVAELVPVTEATKVKIALDGRDAVECSFI